MMWRGLLIKSLHYLGFLIVKLAIHQPAEFPHNVLLDQSFDHIDVLYCRLTVKLVIVCMTLHDRTITVLLIMTYYVFFQLGSPNQISMLYGPLLSPSDSSSINADILRDEEWCECNNSQVV